ncbi:MAG: RidA family protein [Erythrobacter sp.]
MRTITTAFATGVAIVASPALADGHEEAARSEKQTVMPEGADGTTMFEQFGFSESVIHGDTVFLSGVILGAPREGETMEQAFERGFRYIGTVLERSGSTWDEVIDITTYHVDIEDSMPALAAVKNRYVKAPFPAWTAIDIDRLFTPNGLVEIKVTARVKSE